MAGTLTISTLSDGTNSTSSTNCIQGSAKAWVNFDGTSGTRRASYNVSSVTRNGTGDYTLNFTNALSDANYTAVCMTNTESGTYQPGGAAISATSRTGSPDTQTTTQLRVKTGFGNSAGAYDFGTINISVFR